MENNEKVIDVLNDLVQINNDRIKGYEKAIDDSKNEELGYDSLFSQMIHQSEEYKHELIAEIQRLGGEADESSTTNSGKIYRAWMEVKATFQGHTDKSALELCEFGEDAAQKAYKDALSTDGLTSTAIELLSTQKAELKESHDVIKKNRDMKVDADS
ncbi:MAG: PA2169 family four-helix-bundle protein [Ginsengibacter sp.]